MELYLEAHITISPVFDNERELASTIARRHGFKLAHLVMLRKETDITSTRDTFMTGHSKNIDDLARRTKSICEALVDSGFKVWRYKIESCVIDSRQTGDQWNVLDVEHPSLPLIACDGCMR